MKNNEYLTEKSLGIFLERFNTKIIHNKKLDLGYFSFRPDYFLPELGLIVEFNGYHHYTKASQILKDYKKKFAIENLQEYENIFLTFIEIPYFIQLDEQVINLLFKDFNIDTSTFNKYPHGFIDKKAILPADFCTLGVSRFLADLKYFDIIEPDIYQSLENLKESGKDPLEVSYCFLENE